MGYYVTFDGGGSKSLAILFDDQLRYVASARSGSINRNGCTEEGMWQHLHDCFSELLAIARPVAIERLYVCTPGSNCEVLEALQHFVPVHAVTELTEGEMACLSADVGGTALVVIAGTGTNISHYQNGKPAAPDMFASGWGALVYDGGSGYSVGRGALQAAVADVELYGPPTMLTREILLHYGEKEFSQLRIRLYNQPSPVREIASLAPLVAHCAEAGDAEALRVLHWNAEQLLRQVSGYLKRFPECISYPLVTAGGAWKLTQMRNFFCARMAELYPTMQVVAPRFEPVMGGALLYGRGAGYSTDELTQTLIKNFSRFTLPDVGETRKRKDDVLC